MASFFPKSESSSNSAMDWDWKTANINVKTAVLKQRVKAYRW